MTTGKQYNDKFKSHLGQGGAKAHKYCHMSGGPWCCAEVSLVYGETDKKLFYGGKYCTYCPNAIKWAKAFLAQVPMYLALNGDLIFFDWNNNGVPDHIGEVDYKISNEKIATVEGNTGKPALVRKKKRPAKYVLGVFRPLFIPPKNLKKSKLSVDGDFGYHSIYMLQVALGMNPTGILTKDTVKNLQKRVGATVDGAWGDKTSRAVQKWCGAKQDGEFYKNSVIQLQNKINDINYHEEEKPPAQAETEPSDSKKYEGKFPEPNNNVKITNGLAYRLCYPYGTPKKKYMYSTGKPKPEYKEAIDKAYPDHMKWSNKKQRVGACCDIYPGTVMRLLGIPMAKHLKDQVRQLATMKGIESNGHCKASEFEMGDIVHRLKKNDHGHTWIVCELINGKKYVANSHYRKLKGCYAVMDAKPSTVNPKKYAYYYCHTITGAIRTDYRLNDYGYDVLYIQKFLNWYSSATKVKEDGDFGKATQEAVERFQKAENLTIDGRVGEKTIKKMQTFTKGR